MDRTTFLNQYGKNLNDRARSYLSAIFGSVKLCVNLGYEIQNVDYSEYPDDPWDFEKLTIGFNGFSIGILHKSVNTLEAGRYSATDSFLITDRTESFPNMGSLQVAIREKLTPSE